MTLEVLRLAPERGVKVVSDVPAVWAAHGHAVAGDPVRLAHGRVKAAYAHDTTRHWS